MMTQHRPLALIGFLLLALLAGCRAPSEPTPVAETPTPISAEDDAVATPEPTFGQTLDEELDEIAADLTGNETSDSPEEPVNTWIPNLTQIILAILVLAVGVFVLRFLLKTLAKIAERNPKRRLTINRPIPIINLVIWTLILYFSIVILRPPLETVFTLGASLAIALGFALQDVLRNIFGGLLILIDRPFQLGDKIQIGDNYGEVVQIGLRSIRIVTSDDNLVTIPNGEMMNATVSNANAGAANAQVVAEFYLPIDIDIQKTKQIAYRAAAVSRYVYLNKPIAIIFSNQVHMARPMLKMRLKAYVLDVRYEFPFSSEMTEIVVTELLENGLISAEADTVIVPQPELETAI